MTDTIDNETLAGLVKRFGKNPKAHRSGVDPLRVVYADPGNHDFYYRERKSDSVAAYVRVDIIGSILAEVIALRTELATCNDVTEAAVAEVGALMIEIAALRKRVEVADAAMNELDGVVLHSIAERAIAAYRATGAA